MDNPVLFGVIVVQVLVFQFLAVRLTRALPDFLVGFAGLPDEAAGAVERFKRSAGRLRYAIGGALWVAAVLFALVLPIGRTEARLALAAISLTSSAVLAVGLVLDRRAVRAITDALPDPVVRTAGLSRPSLARHYPAAWEAAPLALFLVTLCFTLWGVLQLSAGGAVLGLYVFPTAQAIFVFGALYWSMRAARAGRALPQRSRPFLGSAESGPAASDALVDLELRYFLAAKIGVTLMLGLMQAKAVVAATGGAVPRWLGVSPWLILVLLLGLFAAYGWNLSAVKKRIGGSLV